MWIPKEVERVILETIEDIAIYDIIDSYLEILIKEAAVVIASVSVQSTKDLMEKEELGHMYEEYLDRGIAEATIENISRLYEEEEENIHLREQQKKIERDEVKRNADISKA